jgi:hypothetical protein
MSANAEALRQSCLACWERRGTSWVPDHAKMRAILPLIDPCLGALQAQAQFHPQLDHGIQLSRAKLLKEKARILCAHPEQQPQLVESERAAADAVRILTELMSRVHSTHIACQRNVVRGPQHESLTTHIVSRNLMYACLEWANVLIEMDGDYARDRTRWASAYASDHNARYRPVVLLLQEQCLALAVNPNEPLMKDRRALRDELRRHIPPAQLPAQSSGAAPTGPKGPLTYRHFAQAGLPPQLVYPAPPPPPPPHPPPPPPPIPLEPVQPPPPPPAPPSPLPLLPPTREDAPLSYQSQLATLEERLGLPHGPRRPPNHRLVDLEAFAQLKPTGPGIGLRIQTLTSWAEQNGF